MSNYRSKSPSSDPSSSDRDDSEAWGCVCRLMTDPSGSTLDDEGKGAVAELPAMPSFPDFYRAVNGRDPFPWQARLAESVEQEEKWPDEVGVPTGLGKTACLDIAIWWLASQADRAPEQRTAPTRIWWVVNRRLLVDSTAEHARLVADALAAPKTSQTGVAANGALSAAADRLRSLWSDPSARPLDVISLRGGIASRTPTDPARPTVLLCTLPMYGSRLLFRGYGSTRPAVDAAMAGTDSLVLLDEAHLAPHLRTLIPAVAECTPTTNTVLCEARSRPLVSALTATGDATATERFDLDGDDHAHPVVRQRLDAVKPTAIWRRAGGCATHLADAALTLLNDSPAPRSLLVFANTPATAREVLERLRTVLPPESADVVLLTGLNREREAELIRARVLDSEAGLPSNRPESSHRERHMVVVATQTLEVGTDLDANYLVTEACGVRALTQRLGRLNRLGRFGHARAIYVHAPPPPQRSRSRRTEDVWPVYGTEPSNVLERLLDASKGNDGETVNLSPRAIAEILGPPNDHPGRAPEILPGILWEWVKTTIPPDGEAPVEPYFSGIGRTRNSVSLIWRVHVPEAGKRLWPRATDREAIDLPLGEVRGVFGEDEVSRLDWDTVTVERISAARLKPGDHVVVPSDRGLLDAFGWNPACADPVLDISILGRGLPLHADAIHRLCGLEVAGLVDTALGNSGDDVDVDRVERLRAAQEVLEAIRAVTIPHGWSQSEWHEFVQSLTPIVHEARLEVPRLTVRRPRREETPSDEFDELSLGDVAVELDRHCEAVGARAEHSARRLGLAPDLIDVVERAARLHDIGKTDPRFQAWLGPDRKPGVLLAKSNAPRHRWEAMRVASGWPRGGRHEDLSARLVGEWLGQTGWGTPVQRDLLLHLVISHHGKGRPLVRPVRDGSTALVSSVVEGVPVETSADLAAIDWEQPERFARLHEVLGPWGLALLEAIVIRADHAVSAGVEPAREEL